MHKGERLIEKYHQVPKQSTRCAQTVTCSLPGFGPFTLFMLRGGKLHSDAMQEMGEVLLSAFGRFLPTTTNHGVLGDSQASKLDQDGVGAVSTVPAKVRLHLDLLFALCYIL